MSAPVHIVLADRGWVLESIGGEISRRLPYVSVGDEPDPTSRVNYYINYSAYKSPVATLQMAWFTHVEEAVPEAAARFFHVANKMDVRVCHSELYAEMLRDRGLDSVHVIRPGVDLEAFTPKLRLGLVGRTYPSGRKGEALVESLADIPWIEWHATGEGWPVPSRHYEGHEMPDFYRSIDYLLVPSKYEGGPMPAVEAMACGKEVISPEIGMMPEVPHIHYRNSDREDLLRVLRELHQKQLDVREAVVDSTWDAFAESHDVLFHSMVPELASKRTLVGAASGMQTSGPMASSTSGLPSELTPDRSRLSFDAGRPSAPPPSAPPLSAPAGVPGAVGASGSTRIEAGRPTRIPVPTDLDDPISGAATPHRESSAATKGTLRILLADRAREYRGGPAYRVPRTAEALRARGHHVDITGDKYPDARGYDIVHVFNLWPPQQAGEQLDHLRSQGATIVFSPVYMELRELYAATPILMNAFADDFNPRLRAHCLTTLAETAASQADKLIAAGAHPMRGYLTCLRHCFTLVDGLIVLGDAETEGLGHISKQLPPVCKVLNAPVADDRRAATLPAGLAPNGYVVCTARLEPRKNQLLMIEALRGTGIPLVLAGYSNEPDYQALCHEAAEGESVVFLDHQSHEDGSYQTLIENAAALVLPSWVEGAPIAALEAASFGTRVVLSDRGAVREYFGTHAQYCEPGDIASIRNAITAAWNDAQQRGSRDETLRRHVVENFTWERVAAETEAAYRTCLESREVTKPDFAPPPVHANLAPYPIPCQDPAPGRWTERARELWPGYLRGELSADYLLELGRVWLAMRQPGATRDLLRSNRDRLGPLGDVLEGELASFHLDESVTQHTLEFYEALHTVEGVKAQMRPNERFHLWSAMAATGAPSVFVELGSFMGGTTALMGEFLRRRGADRAALASVDIIKPREYWDGMRETGLADRVHHVKHRTVETAQTLLANGAKGTADLILVDADHRYEAVLADIEAWLPILKPGGIIVFHDYAGALDPLVHERYMGMSGVFGAVMESLGCVPGFRQLFYPLVRPKESVWVGFPSVFSTIAAFRMMGSDPEEGASRRDRFLKALAVVQKEAGNLRGSLEAVRATYPPDSPLADKITTTLERFPDPAAAVEEVSTEPTEGVAAASSTATTALTTDGSTTVRSFRRFTEKYPETSSRIPATLAPVAVRWVASVLAYNGYAWLSRHTLPELVRQGAGVQLQSYREDRKFLADLEEQPLAKRFWHLCRSTAVQPDVHVVLHPPVLHDGTDVYEAFRNANSDFAAHVGITMFETDRLPVGWAESMNQMDEIWVPSTFNRASFERYGVDPKKLQIVPFGIDASVYGPGNAEPLPLPDRAGFLFLSVFQWYKRKGWDVLLRAYIEEFGRDEDVCLLLRSYPGADDPTPIEERVLRYVESLGRTMQDIPPIKVISESLSEDLMPSLFASADAFVLPTRGEGWGIPFMESMASGVPVIATRWSAHLDFVNDDNGYLIDVERMVRIDEEQTRSSVFYESDHEWAEPSLAHLKQLMRRAFSDRSEARAKGERARRDIVENWTIERTGEWIIDRCMTLRHGSPPNLDREAFATEIASGPSLPMTQPPPAATLPATSSPARPSPAAPAERSSIAATAPPEAALPGARPMPSVAAGAASLPIAPSSSSVPSPPSVLAESAADVELPLVVWSSPLLDASGYADEARTFLLGLDEAGLTVRANPLQWSDRVADLTERETAMIERVSATPLDPEFIHVQHIFPRSFSPSERAVANVGRTMFETDRIPADWVDACNRMTEIWVPSEFNRDTFTRSGVDPSRIHVIPGSIDIDRFGPHVEPLDLPDRASFNFLSVFDLSLRKGWDVLLRAFVTEFRPDEDVALHLKIGLLPGQDTDTAVQAIHAYLESTLGVDVDAIPDVILMTETLSQELVARLYRTADAFVLPSRGEGWGRPYMEAMASGLPTIGTGWSGNTEFMNDSNAYLIESSLVDVPEAAVREAAHFRGHRWAEPDPDHLRRLLRHVYQNRDEAAARGAEARSSVARGFDRSRIAALMAERFKVLASLGRRNGESRP